jgi:DNA-binding transcriptional MerR regulator
MNDANQYNLKESYLSLGRFAQAAQLSRKALRLYDQLGILTPSYVDPLTGYRYYEPDQLEQARFIRLLRGMEMALADIRRVLAATTPDEALILVTESQHEFENRAKQVHRATEKVIAYIKKEQDTMSLEISVKKYPQQQVVSLKKNIRVPAFHNFIPEACDQISTYILESGARISGDPFCFYYGPVNESDDGPVEICFPFEGTVEPGEDYLVRTVPAHQAAFGRASKEDSQFPEILEVWDSVVEWVQRNKYKMTEEPVACYEIWHEDFTISVVQPFKNGG